MEADGGARRRLLRRIRGRRASINTYVHKKQPFANLLANVSIVSSAIVAALMAGPAFGGTTFAETVQKGWGWDRLSSVWRLLCFVAFVVAVVAAISANLNNFYDLTARISKAEACGTELEGLETLIEGGVLPVDDASMEYQKIIKNISFIEEDLPVDVNAHSDDEVARAPGAPQSSRIGDLAQQWRSAAFLLPATAILLAGLVLLTTMIGLFLGLSGGSADR